MTQDSRNPQHNCFPVDHPLLGRRELLQAGGLTLLGVGLSDSTLAAASP